MICLRKSLHTWSGRKMRQQRESRNVAKFIDFFFFFVPAYFLLSFPLPNRPILKIEADRVGAATGEKHALGATPGP